MSTKRGDLCGETARELKDRREGGTVLERVNHPPICRCQFHGLMFVQGDILRILPW